MTKFFAHCFILRLLSGWTMLAYSQTRTLRIVTYNIAADTGGVTGPLPGLIAPPGDTNNFQAGGVLAGLGEEMVGTDAAQALDILALQETTSNPLTVTPIVNGLNTFYGVAGMYSNSTFQATSSGGVSSGGGPNALVYNRKTLQLLASVGLTPPSGTRYGSSSGMYRQVMRYQFAPAGVAPNDSNVFYIYVSHYKSGTGTANENYRLGEAQIIRNNSATLPANARILYVGDFNTGVAAEGMYTTLIAPGINQAVDPVNPTGNTSLTWDANSYLDVKTFSPKGIHYRDDYQLMTTNVYIGIPGGLSLVRGTYRVFGNNGSIAYLGNVTAASNTALNNRLATNGPVFISAAQLYKDLTNASDHLPVVADYTIPLPVPVITSFTLDETNLVLNVANCITGGVFNVLMSTNLSLPLTGWTVLSTNVANSGSCVLTATNTVDTAAPSRFYRLLEN